LAFKNVSWIAELDNKINAECLLSYDTTTDPTRIAEVAGRLFTKVHQFKYNAPPKKKWPQAPNWAFHECAWHMQGNFRDRPWLWLESDCVPVRPGWFEAIKECHEKGGKPFTGHWNYQTKVWNGVSVYPWNTPNYGTKLMLVENNPWDVLASPDIYPHLNIANHLFQHIWHDDATKEAYTFPTQESARRTLRPGVVLFHRCKDGTLIDRLRGIEDLDVPTATFVHGGDIGDLIYALPTMKALGGGRLALVPFKVREPFNESKAQHIIPLLAKQGYIHSAEYFDKAPSAPHNFNSFRSRYKNGKTLASLQSEMFGLNGETVIHPWLTVDRPVRAGDFSVIIHRSSRYHNAKFPWKTVMQKYGGKALFVGMEREWSVFTKAFGKIEYHRTADFLELARVIAGAKLFIGNQSAPYAIAEGLKKPAILESCPAALDCQFSRPDLQNDPNGKIALPEI
jgi:hypothetical protein